MFLRLNMRSRKGFCLLLQILILSWILMGLRSARASLKDHPQERREPSEHYEGIHEKGPHHEKGTSEHETSHGAAALTDQGLPADVPLIYLFYWGTLILVMVIILIYFVYRFKRKPGRPIISLAIFLVLFVVVIYGFEILTPVFSGRFDLTTSKIVHEFHESANLGFMRFLYKFLLGVFLTVFAFLNLDRKRYKSVTKTED